MRFQRRLGLLLSIWLAGGCSPRLERTRDGLLTDDALRRVAVERFKQDPAYDPKATYYVQFRVRGEREDPDEVMVEFPKQETAGFDCPMLAIRAFHD